MGNQEEVFLDYLDEIMANIQRAFQTQIPYMDNLMLIETAKELNDKLFWNMRVVGNAEKLAIAETLILMHAEMDKRIQKAGGKQIGLPKMEGITWEKDDPLAGMVEGIPPFSMIDWVE